MGSSDTVVRRRIVYSGTVQGVGFRYRAKYAADGCGVTGWVQNEWDGTVTMEAQGTEAQINEMMRVINNSPYIRIDGIDSTKIPVAENSRGFKVRY